MPIQTVLNNVACKTVQNISTVDQRVYDEDGVMGVAGQSYIIHPGSVQTLPEELADLFLERRRGFVISYEATQIPNIPGEPLFWLANGTGNPMLPETIEEKTRHDGKIVVNKIPNHMRVPRVVEMSMGGGQRTVKDSDGIESSENIPPILFAIPPYRRVAVCRTYYDFLERRVTMLDEHARTTLFAARAPGMCEPSEEWPLDVLRAYAQLLEYKPILQKPELYGKPEADYKLLNGELDTPAIMEQRKTLAAALFFVCCDPAHELPGTQTFEEFLKSKGISYALRASSTAGITTPPKRNPGRPKLLDQASV
jgi:hypothetical protein